MADLRDMTAVSTDTNDFIVPKGEGALVSTGDMEGLELLMPSQMDDNEVMPLVMQYLSACFVRAQDEDFVEEMIKWLEENTPDAVEGRC